LSLTTQTGRTLRGLVRLSCARPRVTILVAVLLAALSVAYAVRSLGFKTDQAGLLPRTTFLQRYTEFEKQFGDLDDLVIVVDARSLPEAQAYAARLVHEIRARSVPLTRLTYRVDPKQFEGRALLYLSKERLAEIRDKIFDYQEFMEAFAARPTLDQIVDGIATQIANSFVTGFFDLGLSDQKQSLDLRFIDDLVAQISGRLERPTPYRSPFGALFSFGLHLFSFGLRLVSLAFRDGSFALLRVAGLVLVALFLAAGLLAARVLVLGGFVLAARVLLGSGLVLVAALGRFLVPFFGLVPAAALGLAGVADPGDHLADLERVALLGHDLDEDAVGVGVVGHVGLVGLDLDERLAALDLAALVDEPLEHGALLHRVREAGHRDVAGHASPQRSRNVARAACTTCSGCGNAACSSGFEYGIGTSAPVTRCTGASSQSKACS